MTKAARRIEAERKGRRGEAIAAWWLRLGGWRVLARRQRVAGGEVDLVVRRGRTVAFVEVKWRADPAALDLAIDDYRLRRVAAAANVLAPRFVGPRDQCRIDVVLIAPGRWPRRIANGWQPGA